MSSEGKAAASDGAFINNSANNAANVNINTNTNVNSSANTNTNTNTNSNGPLSPSAAGQDQPKLLKLISVSFKEAALDSPTFRASVNHYNHLIEQTEQWIDGLLKFIRKFPQYYSEFKDFTNILITQLNPSFISDGIIDQDYILSALTSTLTGLNSLWSSALRTFKIDDAEQVSILTAAKNDIKSYRECRKAFEIAQSKYDLYLSRYSAQSKTKEPSALREDAFQLSEVRKAYIHISLEVCIALSNIQKSLDSALVGLSVNLWKDVDLSLAASNPHILELYQQIEKIKSWAKACDFSLKILSKDMNTARKQIEESAIQQFTPSRDLNDHNPALINPASLLDLKEPVFEKHGWLFMKTSVGKPARQIWVRRWAFVKNGMFGLLNLAPSKTFVQETDKIGVLLCNVRYAPNEDRRFCFEIKTIDTTIILQAETLNELKYWLKVFATEKKRSLEQIDKKKMTSSAFGRYPPLFGEFASTATTTSDFELTSGKIEINNSNGAPNNVITSSNLSRLMNTFNKSTDPEFNDYVPENLNDVQFSKEGVFQEPILNTPISTRLTKAAIIASGFTSPTVVPSAINANIWGTVNWGMYYLVSANSKLKNGTSSTSSSGNGANSDANNGQGLLVSQRDTENLDRFASAIYPPYYPKYLINDDIQMKALFETALKPGEHCLLSFRCIWSPNSKQELSGRCFVTMDNIYFYMNSMGFVSLLMKDLNELISVDSHYKKNWEILKVYAVDGLNMRAKIFLDDARVIASKLEILINNKTAEKPSSFKELVLKIQQVNVEFEKLKQRTRRNTATLESSLAKSNLGSDPASMQAAAAAAAAANISLPAAVANGGNGSLNINNLLVVNKSNKKNDAELPSLVTIPEISSNKDFTTDYNAEYDRLVCDKEIALPAKALFHVLFGDDSIIFKEVFTMIIDGQGDGYTQLPWKTTKSNNKLQRKIVFKLSTNSKNSLLIDSTRKLIDNYYNGIVLGKMSELHTINDLVDNQYYNISTERSSLELPLGAPFKMKAKIIIKAIDQDSCKFLIYSKLDFSSRSVANVLVANLYRSLFKDEARKMIERVQKCVADIGAYGKVNKAIKLYGQLGTKILVPETDAELAAPIGQTKKQQEKNIAEKQKLAKETLDKDYTTDDEATIKFGFLLFVKLWLKVTAIRGINLIAWIIRLAVAAIKLFFVSLSMNKFLILLLALSLGYNLWLSGKTTTSFWVAKRTEKMINEYTRLATNNIVNNDNNNNKKHNGGSSNSFATHNGGLMQRAIYSKDIEEMISQGKDLSIDALSSKCFTEFKKNSFVLNFENSSLDGFFLQRQYGDVASLLVAQKLQNTLQEIGIRRNELLIDLKILERVEREIAIGEWKNWLLNENNRCQFVKEEILAKVLAQSKKGGKDGKSGNSDNASATAAGGADDNARENIDVDKILPGASELLSYCDSCAEELQGSYLL